VTHKRGQLGFTLIEILVVVSIVLIILSIAIPNILGARLNASEVMVIREIQTIHQAETQYFSQFGEYAATLAKLGPPAEQGGAGGAEAANLLPAALARGEKNGYRFEVTATQGGFMATATPVAFGKTGRRTFYIDQDGVVHQNWGPEAATAASPTLTR
jgi:type IV pilus assembly protein PilA